MWAGATSFSVSGNRIVVRSNDPNLHELLRRILSAHIADNDERHACCTYSLVVTDGAGSGSCALYRGSTLVVRSRERSRVVAILLAHLSAHSAVAKSPEYLHLHALAFVSQSAAVIVPWDVACEVAVLRRRTEAAGWRLLDAPVLIDPQTGEFVVDDNQLDVDWLAFEELDEALALKTGDAVVSGGRYAIKGWAFSVGMAVTSRASAHLAAVGLVVNREAIGSQQTLDGVTVALTGAGIRQLEPAPSAELARPLLAVLGAGRGDG